MEKLEIDFSIFGEPIEVQLQKQGYYLEDDKLDEIQKSSFFNNFLYAQGYVTEKERKKIAEKIFKNILKNTKKIQNV